MNPNLPLSIDPSFFFSDSSVYKHKVRETIKNYKILNNLS